jgi:hypothetical protein
VLGQKSKFLRFGAVLPDPSEEVVDRALLEAFIDSMYLVNALHRNFEAISLSTTPGSAKTPIPRAGASSSAGSRARAARADSTLPPEGVLEKVIRALESDRPAPRYFVTALNPFAFPKRALPDRALDGVFARLETYRTGGAILRSGQSTASVRRRRGNAA